MTRRYEKRERPVTISSVSPSANAARSALVPVDLKGSTATQKPSSARADPESAVGKAREGVLAMGAFAGVCRARSRNSLLTSRAVCTRCRGSFSKQRRIMRARSAGRSGRMSVTGVGTSRRIAEISSATEVPVNGCRPVAISCSTTPSEKMSVR